MLAAAQCWISWAKKIKRQRCRVIRETREADDSVTPNLGDSGTTMSFAKAVTRRYLSALLLFFDFGVTDVPTDRAALGV